MRIFGYNDISKIYGTQTTKKTTSTSKTGKSFGDVLEMSSMAKDFQVAKQALAQTPDVRENKVREIKERMANGSYYVSPEDFANKILSK